jgi:hypothetical protein
MKRTGVAKGLVENRVTVFCVLFISLLCIFAVGCEPASNYSLTAPNAKDFPFTQSVNDVTVYANPWTNAEVVKKQFSADLLKEHLLPVQIIIENRSNGTVRFSSTQSELVFAKGHVLKAVGEGEIARRTNENSTAPWLIYIGTLGLGVPISAMVENDIEKKNLQAGQIRQEIQLSSVIVDSQQMMGGFLFFEIPVYTKISEKSGLEANFVIRRLAQDSGGYLTFNIPLSVEKK